MRIPGARLALTAAAALAVACGGRSEDSPSGFDVASEFARVASAADELATARHRLDSARTVPPGPDAASRPAGAPLREAQAAFDATYARTQKVLARFLTIALNEAPARPETRNALDLYAREAVSNGRYTLEHGGDRAAALKGLEDAERAYRVLGLVLPREAASTMEELRRTPAPAAGAGPAATAAPYPAGAGRRQGRHTAPLHRPRTPR